jgi:hypothetical protein
MGAAKVPGVQVQSVTWGESTLALKDAVEGQGRAVCEVASIRVVPFAVVEHLPCRSWGAVDSIGPSDGCCIQVRETCDGSHQLLEEFLGRSEKGRSMG